MHCIHIRAKNILKIYIFLPDKDIESRRKKDSECVRIAERCGVGGPGSRVVVGR